MTEEYQYLNLISEILETGSKIPNRTEGNTISIFGANMRFSLKNSILPLLTTKHIQFDFVVKELLWFISGSTDANVLSRQNVSIWNANGSRKTLDSLGFNYRSTGDLGPIYGFQWRHYGTKYKSANENYKNLGN